MADSIWPHARIAIGVVVFTLMAMIDLARRRSPGDRTSFKLTLMGLNVILTVALMVFAKFDYTHRRLPEDAYIIALGASAAFCVLMVFWILVDRARGRR